ncbi:MAG TPA: MFS transporter [Gemmataceae bacterium]|nr:MFS transporter [Gemmataceae bacterium]
MSEPSFPEQPAPTSPPGGPPVPPAVQLTATHWLILCIAALGFAFDIYELLVMPIIARPALASLLGVDPNTASGTQAILEWTGYIMWGSALCGGTFGLLGGYLTDRFGRRRVLMWSILLYAGSALASGFATSAPVFLVLRCTTFIGVCLEFVAAVAWLAELFPNPHQREAVLGYTQAFSSLGGLLVTGVYYVINQCIHLLPAIHGDVAEAWRYTLISGVIPALPLIIIRPFLPESPAWQRKREAGTLKRPSFGQLFQGNYKRTTLITAALFACGYGAAFGAIQMTPQMVPGLDPELAPLPGLREAYEGSKSEAKRAELGKQITKLGQDLKTAVEAKGAESTEAKALKVQLDRSQKSHKAALAASSSESKQRELLSRVQDLQVQQEKTVASVQFYQEIGGLIGRFVLAWLALRIVSRRRLLWTFQIPGLLIIPLVYYFPAAGNLPENNLEMLRWGMLFVGFFTVAQFSFWGNYLPRMYPVYLRGTGESFAANVGGRMLGTSANFLTTRLALLFLVLMPTLARSAAIAYAAAAVVLFVYAAGTLLTFFLPEPGPEFED